ncbi:MAG TPA: hypothetical protein VH247_01490 [Thermoleophilaceae bacterium]|nr:hypothetical protein [Thermoleophilaceae bacterium]
MNKPLITIAAALACLAFAGPPALATDEPPPSAPPSIAPVADGTPTAPATPGSGCVDTTRPTTRLKSTSRTASKRHVLRGTATDKGCSTSFIARIQVSIARRHGKRCQFVTRAARLSRKSSSCSKPHWLTAAGTASWSLRIPKRLPKGSYQVSTRAVDSAGNVERAHARRLALRRSR